MKNLSISNIAWDKSLDESMLKALPQMGFAGLEIAPTRIWERAPYDHLPQAAAWAEELKEKCGLSIPSMQSIWYGRKENIFGTEEEWHLLLDYTRKAIDFAETVHCSNLVFGCPKNRRRPEGADPEKGLTFFRLIADYAAAHHTVIGLEANPAIYGTNYINTTAQALALVAQINSPGLKLNLDVGTMIANGESAELLRGKVSCISHVHISEPFLKPIVKRSLHREIAEVLEKEGYQGFISIEMGRLEQQDQILDIMEYVKKAVSGNETF